MIEKLLCHADADITRIMEIINTNAKGIVFIVNDNKEFLGTLTDGDIRRAILAGCQFSTKAYDLVDPESPVKKQLVSKFRNILSTKPAITAHFETDIKVLLKLVNKRIHTIPLLDDKGKVVNFFEYHAKSYVPITSPSLEGNELNYVCECIETNWISSQGRFVSEFENSFAEFCQTGYALAVMNGTAAIHLALKALNIKPGDEVILPDLTFAASINPILEVGATPVIVDIEKESWCINPIKIEEAVTAKTKAILPVHLYGQACDMEAIMNIAKQHNIYVIEDAAEAHGAEYNGKKVGSFGDIGCFSFFGNKILTTGEGGMCVTNNKELLDKMAILRDHGMNPKKHYWHDCIGYNYRMTNLQAAVGLAQLERIEGLLAKRKTINEMYCKMLGDCDGLQPQSNIPGRKAVTWLVSYLLAKQSIDRDIFIKKARQSGIDIRPFFYPLSDMELYEKYSTSFTEVAHTISRLGINLPTLLDENSAGYHNICIKIKRTIKSME